MTVFSKRTYNEKTFCYQTLHGGYRSLPVIIWEPKKRCEDVSTRFSPFLEMSSNAELTTSAKAVVCCSTENQNEKKADPPLSALEEDLLSAIGNKEKYGLEIAKALTDANEGAREFSPGSLYPTLRRLEGKGYLNSRWGEDDDGTETRGGARRRYYQITDSGLKKLRQTRQFRNQLISENYGQSLVCPQ